MIIVQTSYGGGYFAYGMALGHLYLTLIQKASRGFAGEPNKMEALCLFKIDLIKSN